MKTREVKSKEEEKRIQKASEFGLLVVSLIPGVMLLIVVILIFCCVGCIPEDPTRPCEIYYKHWDEKKDIFIELKAQNMEDCQPYRHIMKPKRY